MDFVIRIQPFIDPAKAIKSNADVIPTYSGFAWGIDISINNTCNLKSNKN